jgi:peptidoglycan/LPS O-acetylase OafA/YrhL
MVGAQIKAEVADVIKHGRVRWFVIAFVAAGLLMSGFLWWQLSEITPDKWCQLAKQGSPELAGSCASILLRLLDLKDHTIIGLLFMLGLSFLSLAVVALGVHISAEGPAGLKTEVSAETTSVTDGSSVVEVPTPRSEERPEQ